MCIRDSENTEDLYAGIEFDEGAAEVEELSQLVERSGQKKMCIRDSLINVVYHRKNGGYGIIKPRIETLDE